MKSITNLLQWLYDNWATVSVIIILILGLYGKIKKIYITWQTLSEEERQKQLQIAEEKAIASARVALSQYILSFVARSEYEWADIGSGLGAIKRADVIREIFDKYPILENVADQQELINYIDNLINEALKTVRETVRKEVKNASEIS